MSEIFLGLFNRSLAAGWIVLVVLLLRLLFKKAPKWIFVMLWGIVAVRLLCPFSIESAWSLMPASETVGAQVLTEQPEINTGFSALNEVINPVIQEVYVPIATEKSMNILPFLVLLFSRLWALGVAGMLGYAAFSYLRIKRKVCTAVLLRENIFQSEFVSSPFVLGFFAPRIYLPFGMGEEEAAYVIAHEQAHIRRKDHWWKPLGYLLLAVYWFHPLLWVGYLLLCRDIEQACDEKVIQKLDPPHRAAYSEALLACSVHRRSIAACPLAFGEVEVKSRIKSILNYKKPTFWVILVALLASIVAAVCFLTDPQRSLDDELSVFLDMQIAEHHYSPGHSDGNFITTHYKVLGMDKGMRETTVYLWVLYQEFRFENGEMFLDTGAHIPTVITAKRKGTHGHYELVEYWEPGDGAYYSKDIAEKFPWYLHGKAFDSQLYIDEQMAFCKKAAAEYLETTAPDYSSPPKLYIIGEWADVQAVKGAFSWNYFKEGKGVNTAAQSPPPEEMELPVVEIGPAYFSSMNPLSARLQFNAEGSNEIYMMPPDKIAAYCRKDGKSEPIPVEQVNGNFYITLKEEPCIYEVVASWSKEQSYDGVASYYFAGNPTALLNQKELRALLDNG